MGWGWRPYPSPAFSESMWPGWYPGNSLCVILQNMSECQHCHMSALSESRQRLCISHLDFLINTHRSLFPQEDIKNDLHVV